MTPIKFPEVNVTFAEDQPEYLPLPAWRGVDGTVISCWKLTRKERLKILFTGRLWLRSLTFGRSLQPLLPEVDRPFVATPIEVFKEVP